MSSRRSRIRKRNRKKRFYRNPVQQTLRKISTAKIFEELERRRHVLAEVIGEYERQAK